MLMLENNFSNLKDLNTYSYRKIVIQIDTQKYIWMDIGYIDRQLMNRQLMDRQLMDRQLMDRQLMECQLMDR